MYDLSKAYRSMQKSIATRRVEEWEASNGHTEDTARLFHGPWPFLQVSQIFQRRKSDANKQDFENKLNLTCQAQSTPKTAGILTMVFSTSGPNLMA